MADKKIGDEGAKAMSEMLKVNTALKELYLISEEERKGRRERKRKRKNEWQTIRLEMKEQKQ